MKNGFKLSMLIPASPAEIYKAWMSSQGHSAMTGSTAKVTGKAGGKFSAWDGYISGRTLELEPDRRIVQAWRTSEFADEAPDSHLEVFLEATKTGTKVTITHTEIPPGRQIRTNKAGRISTSSR